MKKYIKSISNDYLQSIHTGNMNIPTMYFHKNKLTRDVFWERLNQISKFIKNNTKMNKNRCLDFGGGSGVFLPTLCDIFKEVILLDLDTSQAEIIKAKFNLNNCKIVNEDIYTYELDKLDCIIVADVIEHFKDTRLILNRLKNLMNEETYILSSQPTENWFYHLIRYIGNKEKPWDHYFNSYEVENVYEELNFKKINYCNIPIKPFNMFSITEWKLND